MSLLQVREPRPRLFRREEYEDLVRQGTFERERVELIRGVIVSMSPLRVAHNFTVMTLSELLTSALGRKRAWVRVQMTFRAGSSLPEPDLACVPRNRDYAHAHPSEALLIVEVADSSLNHDRATKAALYAEAGVPEYWVVDLADGLVEVRRHPRKGSYASCDVVLRGERLRVPGTRRSLKVNDFLPPRHRAS
ncbi:MAG: Uma2 family endonuclease [Myxococcaceae bacterium]|nr:Uma2 family endonuclease [Myxococcaceae bacterium]